nr:hypothetical protein [Desulfocapsaceae bacterium]
GFAGGAGWLTIIAETVTARIGGSSDDRRPTVMTCLGMLLLHTLIERTQLIQGLNLPNSADKPALVDNYLCAEGLSRERI